MAVSRWRLRGGRLLAGLYATQQRSHIRIYLLYDVLPRWVQRLCDVISATLIVVFALAMIWGSFNEAQAKSLRWETFGPAFDPPIPATLKPMTLLIILLVAVQATFNLLADLNKLPEHHAIIDEEEVEDIIHSVEEHSHSGEKDQPVFDIGTISTILLLSMLVLLTIGMPLGFASAILAGAVLVMKFGPDLLFGTFGTGPLSILSQGVYGLLTDYVLISIPLFIFMANLLERSGIASDMYNSLNVWLSRTCSGIAIVTSIMAVIMAAMSGIIGGEVVLLGLIALPQMLRLGTMIPPSIVLIMVWPDPRDLDQGAVHGQLPADSDRGILRSTVSARAVPDGLRPERGDRRGGGHRLRHARLHLEVRHRRRCGGGADCLCRRPRAAGTVVAHGQGPGGAFGAADPAADCVAVPENWARARKARSRPLSRGSET